MPTRPSSSIARLCAAVRSMPRCCSSVSVICRPIVSTGFSEVIGSWNTMPMSPPRTFAHLGIREFIRSRPANTNLTSRDASGRIGDQPQDRQRADRLARAAFADDGDGLAGIDGVGDAVDRAHDSRTGAELGVQIVRLPGVAAIPLPRRSPVTSVACDRCLLGFCSWTWYRRRRFKSTPASRGLFDGQIYMLRGQPGDNRRASRCHCAASRCSFMTRLAAFQTSADR